MDERADIAFLRGRILELEEKVEQLRLSRRILMNLIERIEKEKIGSLNRLERENRKLHLDNYRYAKWLLRKNRQIVELESKLQGSVSHDSAN